MKEILFMALTTILRVAIYGLCVMALFNLVAPAFGLTIELGYSQSCGLTLLSWILFKNEK